MAIIPHVHFWTTGGGIMGRGVLKHALAQRAKQFLISLVAATHHIGDSFYYSLAAMVS